MNFDEAIENIKKVLEDTGTNIKKEEYDGIIVKKLEASNTLDEGRTTKQTHIAITGEQMNMFPYLRADGYFEKDSEGMKKYFVMQIPVILKESNIKYLNKSEKIDIVFETESINTYASIVRSKRTSQADQIQMSLTTLDDKNFIKFRKMLHIGSYLIVLKKYKKFEYECYGILPDYDNDKIQQLNNKFFSISTNTIVYADELIYNEKSESINKYLSPEWFREKAFTGYKSAFSHNRIIFGAPGTGKSYRLNKDREELLKDGNEENYERVTFHPDYSYANFVGTYKPIPYKKEDGEEGITYEYVPGPFMRIYVEALKNSKTDNVKPYLLIIEEINRANVAAVFGDVFQLLDRDENNVSEYPIEASEDVKKYLAKELGGTPSNYKKIYIPDNMFIWATMNSADQGVYPMDTAFKRRWEFSYLGIDEKEEEIANRYIILGNAGYRRKVEWNKLRKAINNKLSSFKVNEDKLLGPYFVSSKAIKADEKGEIDKDVFVPIFKGKVLMYLFEDAAKQRRESLFSLEDKNIKYSSICKEFDEKGVYVFNAEISKEFEKDIVEEENE